MTEMAEITEEIIEIKDDSPEEPIKEPKEEVKKEEKKDKKSRKEERDLTKMKKKDILKIMTLQGEEIDRLNARIAELEAELAANEIKKDKVGSIAQASLELTKIFEEADKAAKIYLENIRRKYE